MQIVALTAFCVMSHCDLDLLSTNLKIHRVNAGGTAYIQAMFRRNLLKNKRENGIQLIWNCWIGIFYFVSLWPWPLTCTPQNVYSSSTCHYLLIDYIWDRLDEKRQRNRVTQVGPIFKECLLVTLTFVLWPCKCISILYLLMSIHQPSFIKIGWKMTEKWRLPVFLFCVLVTLTFDLRTPQSIQLFYKSLSIIWPTLRKIGW